MSMRNEERRRRIASCAALIALPLLLGGCGSDIVIAEQQQASAADAGVPEVIVLCGTARCTDRTVVISGATAKLSGCCADLGRSACGLFEVTCVELGQGGKLDPVCTSLQGTPLGNLAGCCRPDGSCGVLEDAIGFGCTQVPFLSQPNSCTYSTDSH
jgi:hypothetical protein